MAKFTTYDFVVTDRDMVARGGSYSFRNYSDINGAFGNPGAEIFYDDGSKDRQGRPTGKSFSLDQSHYKLQTRDGQKDYRGMAMADFFMNAPFCEGSPNGSYTDQDGYPVSPEELTDRKKNLLKVKSGEWSQQGIVFRLMEDEMDAQLALDAGLKRAEAQMSTGQIDEQTLSEIAAMIGEFGKPDRIMRHRVYEFAGRKPVDYFKLLNSGDRGIRALVRKGVADGILNKKGEVIFWQDTILGNDENAAVATLIGDPKILEGLQAKVSLKVQIKGKVSRK
jgi:hypothetical protein